MRVGVVLLLSPAVALAAAEPAAADEPLTLSWHAPAACPRGEQVRKAALQGSSGASVRIEADATIERGGRWRMTLRTRRGDVRGERILEATSCAALADAAAVILALSLVPPGEAEGHRAGAPPAATAAAGAHAAPVAQKAEVPRDRQEARAPEAAPGSTPAPEPPAPAVPSPERSPDGALAIGAWAATDATTLPSAALGGGGSIAWTPSALRLEAEATAWTEQSSTLPGSTAGARFAMTTIGASACFTIVRARALQVAPCAGGSMHLVSATGFGATTNYDKSARWASADGGLFVRAPLAPWIALRTRVDTLVPLARPTFAVENEGTIHRPPTLGLRATVGAEMTFL